MHELLEKLHEDHKNLDKVLSLLSSQLDHFCAGRESNFDLKIELLEYLETYADQGHHPFEDRIYEVGIKRLDDQSHVLERLLSQHGKLTAATHKFRMSLESILHDGVMSRAELETQGREFVALQRLHLNLEESEVFPLLDARLTKEDWAEIEANLPSHDDPVFEKPDQVRFSNLVYYLTKAEQEEDND
ncbi:MAG: purine catabolism protein pucG [Gammaproteobacteria bacterium]|nr:purine catabolism protein pucG [Gammaproteobacteria bacterium]